LQKSKNTTEGFGRYPNLIALIIIVAACFFAYYNSLFNSFHLDDYIFLNSKPFMRFESFADFFVLNPTKHYIPIYFLVNVIFFDLFKDSPLYFRLFNLGLFVANAFLFFKLIHLWFKHYQIAIIAALLFCVHPIHYVSINHLSSNFVFLSALFLQISMLCFWQFLERDKNKAAWMLTSCLLYVMALLTFEQAVLFPLFVVLVVLFVKQMTIKQTLARVFPYFIIVGAYLVLWFSMVGIRTGFLKNFHVLDLTIYSYATRHKIPL